MRIRLPIAAAALFGCLSAFSAYAQEIGAPTTAPAPANLSFVDGSVDVVLGGVTEPANPPHMLVEGDAVHTRSGRAEVVFGDGTVMHVAPDTSLEILGDERVRLLAGRVIVRLSHAAVRPYGIDTPASSVRLDAQGEYGVTADKAGRLQIMVARGSAGLVDGPQWTVRGGQMLTLTAGGRPVIEMYNSARFDAFAEWSHDRVNGFTTSVSAAQLPYELRPYAPVLDSSGRWDYVAPHGYVWIPSVAASWRPYFDGSWTFTRYGWTWHGRDRWAWPTHHYGRWGFTGAFWFWVPATAWAPAWVSWSISPGYVSWAPYGWHAGPRDVWGRRDHPAYWPDYDPWRGWTVLPRHQFTPRRNVRAHALDGGRLDERTRATLLNNAVPARAAEFDRAVPTRRAESDRAVPRFTPRPNTAVPRAGEREPRVYETTPPPSATPPAGVRRPGRRADHPAYAPPSTPSTGTTERAAGRRGADRDPGARQPRAPQSRGTPSRGTSKAPSVAPPASKGEGERAVPRSGASRRKGEPIE